MPVIRAIARGASNSVRPSPRLNQPNPFDESTRITIESATDAFMNRCMIRITTFDGKMVKSINVPLKKGINEVLFEHGYGLAGTYIYSLCIDGVPVESRKMLFGKR